MIYQYTLGNIMTERHIGRIIYPCIISYIINSQIINKGLLVSFYENGIQKKKINFNMLIHNI